jgi:hypothetical protein
MRTLRSVFVLAVGLAVVGVLPAQSASASAVSGSSLTSFVAFAGNVIRAGNVALPVGDERTAIERFSLRNGRDLGVVARVPSIKNTSEGFLVSNPHLMPDGRYLIMESHDVDCKQVISSECIPIDNSCASRIESLAPSNKRFRVLFTEPADRYVMGAVPSPNGRSVALLETGCPGGAMRIVIRDLRTGHEQMIARGFALCAGDLAWSSNGSEVVFPDPASSSGGDQGTGCSLAVASSRHYSAKSRWRLIAPDDGCRFSASAFDSVGLVAAELCGPVEATPSGELLQFDQHLQVLRKLGLPQGTPGLGSGHTELANDAAAQTVLVSLSEPGLDEVSAFNGHQLRLIGRYKTSVFAEP